ncbi:alpha-galactosidase A [Leptodontidium sp. MPI-SDFR-AT-0119]|nr:alpha-galactosidase A [Leptodontidium sp. MPI-SDFR-AT-0119]
MESRTVPKSEIEVLSQEINEDFGFYRIRAGQRVHYVTIATDVFDEDAMCRPHLLIPQLPDFPDKNWTIMEVSRKSDGSLTFDLSFEALPAVKTIWHPKTIDVLSLEKVKRHRSGVHEVLFSGLPAICKTACFGWQIPRIEHETYTYSVIEEYREPGDPVIAPAFLGHVTENGRVIGMLLEKLEGDFASMDDLPVCREALENFHHMNMVHGDVNRYNFILDRSKEPVQVRLVDFEYAEPYEESKALEELRSLSSELAETTGRGGSVVVVDSV